MYPIRNTELSSHCKSFFESAMELKEKSPEQFRSLFLYEAPIINVRPVKNKFGWWVLPHNIEEFNIPKLLLFHNLLEQHRWTECLFEKLKAHFIDTEKPCGDPIVWMGDVMILVYLFDLLMNDKKIIPKTNSLYATLCQHFVLLDKKTNSIKELSPGSLKTSLSNAKSNSNVCDSTTNFLRLLLS